MDVSDQYLAGLFDGEGSIGIMVRRGSATRGEGSKIRPVHYLSCILSMTHEAAVRLFQTRFGGDFRGPQHRPSRQPIFTWRVCGDHAVAMLQTLRPYLIVKIAQCDVGLEFVRTKVRTKPLPDSEIEKREFYRQKIIQLNGNKKLRRIPVDVSHPAYNEQTTNRQKQQKSAYLLHIEGIATVEIARRLDCPAHRINRWLREMKVAAPWDGKGPKPVP